MGFFHRMIERDFPEYERDRNYFEGGEIITLDDEETVVCILERGLRTRSAIVLEEGTLGKKGDIINVSFLQLPYVEKMSSPVQHLPEDFVVKKHPKEYVAGDLIELSHGFIGVITEVDTVWNSEKPWATVYVLNKSECKTERELNFKRNYSKTKIVIPMY